MPKRFLLVAGDVLPEVFLRVVKAKELLMTGVAKNMSQAAKMVGISRSALYKYKDSIFDVGTGTHSMTVHARLKDEPGALQALLQAFASAGANVITINQSAPQDGVAMVSIMCRTAEMSRNIDDVIAEVGTQPTVVDIRREVQNI